MGSTLALLYDYVQDLKCLIIKAGELAKISALNDELSKLQEIKTCNLKDLNLSIRESEYLISLSRILAEYGFYQTYESFENACLLLSTDYNRAKEAVAMAVEKFKISTSQLYADKAEEYFLWKDYEADDPWALLVEKLTKNDDIAIARRNFYIKRIAKLANLSNLANITSVDRSNEIIISLSPLRLESDFIANDGNLSKVLFHHSRKTNKTDLY